MTKEKTKINPIFENALRDPLKQETYLLGINKTMAIDID